MGQRVYVSNGDIEYLNSTIKRQHQNVYQNETLPGRILRPGRMGQRTRANVRIPVLSPILNASGEQEPSHVSYVDPTDSGLKVVRLRFAFGLVFISD